MGVKGDGSDEGGAVRTGYGDVWKRGRAVNRSSCWLISGLSIYKAYLVQINPIFHHELIWKYEQSPSWIPAILRKIRMKVSAVDHKQGVFRNVIHDSVFPEAAGIADVICNLKTVIRREGQTSFKDRD